MGKEFLKTEKNVRDWFQKNFKSTLALDTETDGVGYGCALKGVSFCNGSSACYIDLSSNSIFDFDEILKFIKVYIENEINLLIGHNLSFDLRVLRFYGINYTKDIYDTQVAAHLLNENVSCALKDIVRRKKFEGWENAIEFKKAVKDGYSSQRFLDYAINDSIWTWNLYELTKPLLTKQGLDKLFYDIEMPFQFVLVDLFENGIKVDIDKLKEFEEVLTAEKQKASKNAIESIELKLRKEIDLFGKSYLRYPINLNSSQQIAKVIEEKLKTKLPRTKPSESYPKGQPSTAAEVLEPLKEKHLFIKHLLKYRQAEKMLNTFVLPMYDRINKDGRLRTSFNDCIARTGRLSSSKPNLQNIPKELSEDDIVNIRKIFIAEKGKCFVRADYDLQEIRQLANVTNDKRLIKALNSNYDIHLYSANGCLNLNIPLEKINKTHPEYIQLKDVKYKKERHIGKNGINFPVIYGSTAYGVALNNSVSEEEAQKWIDGFFKLFPDVKKSIKQCKREIFSNRFVKNYFGRRRRFRQVTPKAIRQGFNFWIQGMCADLLRKVMVELRECYLLHPEWKSKLVLTVHDDIITECKEEYSEKVLEATKQIMENSVNLPVKFLIDIKKCYSYGD